MRPAITSASLRAATRMITLSLAVERPAVADAAGQELRPRRDLRLWIGLLGQEPPQGRMMPAQVLARAVAVRANALAQPACFLDELLARHRLQVVVHAADTRGTKARLPPAQPRRTGIRTRAGAVRPFR